jgi:hypothetical protein
MLQEKAVSRHTLELIRSLQNDPYLSGFHLAGGTALALLLGHRMSIDIDLFSQRGFDASRLLEHLEQQYDFNMFFRDRNTLKGSISGIVIDILTHNYPLVKEITDQEGIRIYSPEDIAAMKVNVISGNGTRIKDFIDIYFLLDIFSIDEIFSFFKKKYNSRSDLHVLKSLGYFGDLPENPEWPVMLKEKDLTLGKIKDKLTSSIQKYLSDMG